MKKTKIAVAALMIAGSSLTLTSCLGSFSLTNRVIAWNQQVSNKFVNELVFFAFWILPVYEVTALADLLVINSIEFWSGNNPMSASTKAIDTDHGRYLINCDGKGYDITFLPTGEKTRLEFMEESNSWAVETASGTLLPFMTFIDDSHVKMITPDGDFTICSISEQGVAQYASECRMPAMAMRNKINFIIP